MSSEVRRTGTVLSSNRYFGLMPLPSARMLTNQVLGYSSVIPSRLKRRTDDRAAAVDAALRARATAICADAYAPSPWTLAIARSARDDVIAA
jgi:hypothetical protein